MTDRLRVAHTVVGGTELLGVRTRGPGLPLGVRTFASLCVWSAVHFDYGPSGIEDVVVARRFRSLPAASASLGGPFISVQFFRCLPTGSIQRGR